MSDESPGNICFVDSNIWLYIFLPGHDDEKAGAARALVRKRRTDIVVSTQVVNEVVNTILRNGAMNEVEIRELIGSFYTSYDVRSITESIQLHASQLRERYSLSHWDSLIVSVALGSQATVLYSEDMQDGLVVDDQLTIVNVFSTD